MFPPGVGSRPKRLINHLISLDCLSNLDRIHAIIFPSQPTHVGGRSHGVVSRSRSPRTSGSYAGASATELHRQPRNHASLGGSGRETTTSTCSSDTNIDVAGVTLRDRYGEPINFDRDAQTTDNLLKVLEAHNVRQGGVKRELGTKDEIMPDDSASNYGLLDARLASGSAASSEVSANSSVIDLASILSYPSHQDSVAIGRCFLAGVLIRRDDGQLVEARHLKPGDHVRSCTNEVLEVRSSTVHAREPAVIELRAGQTLSSAALLTVTPKHRIMVQRGIAPQTIPADSLRQGDRVYCSGGRFEELVSVRNVEGEHEVVEVMFRPDLPVEVFFPSILSKGHGWPKTTRRSSRLAGRAEDQFSIPATEDSWR
eukprot:TRINITY_DN58551_c0_g1_i1.p1 TRINITY_DN58551_c0_g1~~TRINITY_DN58551_c0_g1_i1.p1  ORF type:complete len:370 (+),score=14.13 TRINITY_DN58551_c0_g1_i1:209-1318(+)